MEARAALVEHELRQVAHEREPHALPARGLCDIEVLEVEAGALPRAVDVEVEGKGHAMAAHFRN